MRYSEKQFTPLQPGLYPSSILDVTEGKWPSGDDFIEVTFTLENPENLSTLKVPVRVSPILSKSPKFRVFSDLIALLKKDIGKEGEFDPQDLTGLEVMVRTELEQDKKDPEKMWVRIVEVQKKS